MSFERVGAEAVEMSNSIPSTLSFSDVSMIRPRFRATGRKFRLHRDRRSRKIVLMPLAALVLSAQGMVLILSSLRAAGFSFETSAASRDARREPHISNCVSRLSYGSERCIFRKMIIPQKTPNSAGTDRFLNGPFFPMTFAVALRVH